MPRVDPGLMPVVVDLERGLRELGIPFGIVGALVPELLLDVRPYRMTNDVDLAVVVEDLAGFDLLKERLADYGFARTRRLHRLDHRYGGWVDILPVNDAGSSSPGRHFRRRTPPAGVRQGRTPTAEP